MKTLILLGLLLLSAFSQSCCDANTVKVSGNAEVKVDPDFATITIGASAQRDTTSQALQELNQKIDELIKIIQSQGIPQSDYSTSSLTINQVYDYSNGQSTLIGQKASQTLSVKVRKLTEDGANIGALIDAASQIKNLQVNGVSFEQSDQTLGVRQARKAAFQAAKAKADQYAGLAGLANKRVVKIQSTSPGRIIPFFANGNSFAGDFKTLVPKRQVVVGANVDVWFQIALK